jgi:hypothetical protein
MQVCHCSFFDLLLLFTKGLTSEVSLQEVRYLNLYLLAFFHFHLADEGCWKPCRALTVPAAACCLLAGNVGVAPSAQVIHAAFLSFEEIDGLDVHLIPAYADRDGLLAGVLEAEIARGLGAGRGLPALGGLALAVGG